jgi:hypothetical protein
MKATMLPYLKGLKVFLLCRQTPFTSLLKPSLALIVLHFPAHPVLKEKPKIILSLDPFVCWKVVFFSKVNFRKMNYFSMFGSVMKNKLENTFQCLVMSWKMSWKITY